MVPTQMASCQIMPPTQITPTRTNQQQIRSNQITSTQMYPSQLPRIQITSNPIVPNQVTPHQLAQSQITSNQIALNQITSPLMAPTQLTYSTPNLPLPQTMTNRNLYNQSVQVPPYQQPPSHQQQNQQSQQITYQQEPPLPPPPSHPHLADTNINNSSIPKTQLTLNAPPLLPTLPQAEHQSYTPALSPKCASQYYTIPESNKVQSYEYIYISTLH